MPECLQTGNIRNDRKRLMGFKFILLYLIRNQSIFLNRLIVISVGSYHRLMASYFIKGSLSEGFYAMFHERIKRQVETCIYTIVPSPKQPGKSVPFDLKIFSSKEKGQITVMPHAIE